MTLNSPLPDVTSEQYASLSLPLRWVGMESITVPLTLAPSNNPITQVAAKADIFVSLDNKEAKGIHMSRLYTELNDALGDTPLNGPMLTRLLKSLVASQQGLSESAKVSLSFELTLRKKALKSDQFGYQSYPITLSRAYSNGQIETELSLTIPYSSTCPCSAALSRQALGQAIDKQFEGDTLGKDNVIQWITSEKGSIATPHSQRSYAYMKLTLTGEELPDLSALIIQCEQAIGTPVQTAVKREDEQAFAQLNAENLLFCEDAARRLKITLECLGGVSHYWFKVEHQESLHAHNAVVIDYSREL